MNYTINELSRNLCISEKTCGRWVDAGLKTVPGSKRPILILGTDLKDFIRLRKAKKKFTMSRSEFLCMSCKRPVFAKRGSIKILSGKKIARCRVCNGKISRTIKPP